MYSDEMFDALEVYSNGPVHCSVCVPKEWDRNTIVEIANIVNPTGITSVWSISNESFKTGDVNPTPCNNDPERRLHYLLEC